MVGNLNLNLSDHRSNTNVKDYLNLTFQNFLVPAINKPTKTTKTCATLTDHILANDLVNTDSFTGLVKDDISGLFQSFGKRVSNFSTTSKIRQLLEKEK